MRHLKRVTENAKLPLFDIIIDRKGNIIDNSTNSVITLDEFNNKFGLEVKNKYVLMGIAFHYFIWRPVYWKHLDVKFLSTNSITPETILLYPSEPVESLEVPGFYLIPYYSNVLVNTKGEFLRTNKCEFIVANLTIRGYYTVRVTDDSGHASNMIAHRLMMTALKPIKEDHAKLEVNHIDHDKTNNNIENLEWVTRAENMTAYSNNLVSWYNESDIEVLDVITNQTLLFSTVEQAAKYLNVSVNTVIKVGKNNGKVKIGNYAIRKFTTHGRKWPDEIRPYGWSSKGARSGPGFIIENLETSEKINCGGREAAKYFNVTRESLQRIIREGRNISKDGKFKVTKINPLSST